MLNYRKLTKEQDQMRNIFEKGQYSFEVKSIEEKYCKNKINKMLVVQLLVSGGEHKHLTIIDWIMLDFEDMEWKLRHFCDSIGLIEKYENNTITINDMLAKRGIAKLTIGEYERDGEIIKVNRVTDYISKDKAKVSEKELEPFDDKIPF